MNRRSLVGYRACFSSERELSFCNYTPPPTAATPKTENELHDPITVDGTYRPLITINGRMPGPTIIAKENQDLCITVYNELPNVEGISIHWHGMHQEEDYKMDGVAFITQNPILPHHSFKYQFKAKPAGTHWYHAHSGAHRTDGLYGALIIEDRLPDELCNEDHPDQHTLLLMDWQKEPSIDLFYQIRSSLGFYNEETSKPYKEAKSYDNTQIAPFPFWSGIINDKGRHYNRVGEFNNASLNSFTVSPNRKYRFRLIGAQALYAYRFSIQDHNLTVVATDGNRIKSIENVHYVIVNSGERYDVIVNTNQPIGNYWIIAETLEEPKYDKSFTFHNPVYTHKAEAFLHYEGAGENYDYVSNSTTWNCRTDLPCKFVNCPYNTDDEPYGPICINVDEFENLIDDDYLTTDNTIETKFLNFGFDGEKDTSGSSVEGINFRFPSDLPYMENFSKSKCPEGGCDHSENKNHCACTQVIDLSGKSNEVIEIAITNFPKANETDSSHPVHLHGHTFEVVKVGYPNYLSSSISGQFRYMSINTDVMCETTSGEICERFINVKDKQTIKWSNGQKSANVPYNRSFVKKDTVIVPFGGYTVIRFNASNPGWWLFHCHIEIHQLEGMAAVIKEPEPDGQGSIMQTHFNINAEFHEYNIYTKTAKL